MVTDQALLPEEFADLEPFARIWALPSTTERHERRVSSSMPDMQAFYDAMVPRGEAIFTYLEQYDLDDMPEPALHLMWMMCSLSMVSFAVDVFKQPRVIDSAGNDLPVVFEAVS